MGGVGSGDKLARGGHSATWGPLNVSKEKWEAVFGKSKSNKREKKNANHHAVNTSKRPSRNSD